MSQEQNPINALVQAEQGRFIKNLDYDSGVISTDADGGAVANINGEEILLVDQSFELQIVQPGHANKNKDLVPCIGKLVIKYSEKDMTENIITDSLNLIPITIVSYGFRNYGPYDDKNTEENKLLCYSNDGVLPSEKLINPLSNVCSEVVLRNGEYQRNVVCPYAKWENNKKPDCRAIVTLGFFDVDNKIPLRLQLHGTGMGAWNNLQRAYRQARNVARLKRKSINDYLINLSVEYNGSYVTPIFKLVDAESTLKPSQYLPVCKYYMEKVFSRKPVATEETLAARAVSHHPVEASEEDMKAVAEGQDFTA